MDAPDDVPALDEIPDDGDLPSYWVESTTITVDRWVKASLDEHRDGRPWNEFLEKLRREHADPITFNDIDRIADALNRELDAVETSIDEDAVAMSVYEELEELLFEEVIEGTGGSDNRDVLNRLDDLQSQLPAQIREELR
jgi:hypothetical protein